MQEYERTEPPLDRTSFRAVALWSLASAAAAIGFAVGFVVEASVAVLGSLLAIALAGIAAALRRFVIASYPQVTGVEERPALPADTEPAEETSRVLSPTEQESPGHRLGRRTILVAGCSVAVALVAPATAMGPTRPDIGLRTRWSDGVRLLDEEGELLSPEALPDGGLNRVWPEGPDGLPVREELSSVVLVRVPQDQLRSPTELDAVVDGDLVAYSKVCTHMGCPVGLFRAGTGTLFCPCHQASFDATAGAIPTFGPAERPLPQLPLRLEDGVLVASGDFIGHVGPTTGLRPRQGRPLPPDEAADAP